jgi:hypothetical protein
MHRFISAAGKQVIQYACEIKNACISMFKSDTYADIRLGTFQIIAKVYINLETFTSSPIFLYERNM